MNTNKYALEIIELIGKEEWRSLCGPYDSVDTARQLGKKLTEAKKYGGEFQIYMLVPHYDNPDLFTPTHKELIE